MRGALTGAMVGALNGLNSIPARYIEGLKQNETLLREAKAVASISL